VITSPICVFIFSSLRIEPFPFKLNNTQIKKFNKKRISNFWSPVRNLCKASDCRK
jgi:hypothetical protein